MRPLRGVADPNRGEIQRASYLSSQVKISIARHNPYNVLIKSHEK
ncbi:hypothetical protein HSR121_1887 [Halapricum desulfuricans]|uniref:Uncharacterized protein n=1 Tax=Halapricum desulfuricans TaxID=2841257 RepID=A0A897N142_9EURY|nr:hypothetical protein HSR121_1887 [Halapricum desulfuricans]